MKKPGLFFLALLLLTTGCTTRAFKDIDKRSFVLSMGIDPAGAGDDKYRVTLKLAIPQARQETGQTNSQIVSQDASSIPEAISLIKSKADKELDFSHAKVLVFGEALAQEDITESIDFLVRKSEIQRIANLAIGSPNAAEVLKASPRSERLPADALFLSFGGTGTESPFIVTEYLFDFYRRMTEPGLDPFLPVIKAYGDEFVIKQVAILDKKRVKLMLSPSETAMFNALVHNPRQFEVSVRTAKANFTMLVKKFNRSFSFDRKDARKLLVNISMQGIAEQSRKPLFYEDWSTYEQETGKAIREHVLQLLRKLQANGVDPVGFGLMYRATHYNGEKGWKIWQELYPRLTFDVNVRTEMSGTGAIQ
ncbi:Ger(x)C family spore germination protein [Paenibacillus ehimensis]|uniref:Ger(x)C family spore germination protein n=1 Tax=Paenibacillus ehimensis TaxID=79264 RepID=UPI000FDB2619|nr:Ger(x)C family spore germination protein [Paenibacillus ehimensis]MEC0211951.1 Ger(x)C family spore germination protein [Paenibacillus ehimensis]